MNKNIQKEKGFTLIEVIITFVIAAIAGMVIFAYLGAALTRSHEPLAMVEDLAEAVTLMEEVTARYQSYRGGKIGWDAGADNFNGWLVSEGISHTATTVSASGVNFEMLEVVISQNKQTVSAYFTQ